MKKFGSKAMIWAVVLVFASQAQASKAKAKSNPISAVKNQLVSKGFSHQEISAFFSDPRLKLLPYKSVKAKPVNWPKYQAKILQPGSVAQGVSFISGNLSDLQSAEKQYGVPKEFIAAIIRIETGFGSYTGDYVVPNVFYSELKYNDHVARAQANLVDLLTYCKQQGIDPFTIKGSYAGAIGYPQFMPSSILTYGVDGDGDNKVDLYNPHDFIPSIANFLSGHGFAQSRLQAIAGYYGSASGYPAAALKYASALSAAEQSQVQTQTGQ